ncbi:MULTISPECIES: TetR/AcrR family transcriptional regulator [unclassified Adlercreutzia]|uniref:TetR/AcrR family transcriptional regulator n=1 Tax=unclassified Adlercreutzia TaxID=2636013 RepID=UPI0013ED61FD|nr:MULTISPECIES: TetR/AcrR family transcriptional regulator [unclassified Adlercreutzia]
MTKHGNIDALPEAQREAIVAAGVEAFGRFSYKDARTEDIARRAGISKGLLFFYFRNKRELYLYLMDYLMEKATEIVVDERFWEIDDFFELLRYTVSQKGDAIKRFPYMMEFSLRAFYPSHRDIRDVMNRWNWEQVDVLTDRYFAHVRRDKFRAGITPNRVMRMLIWMGDGYLHEKRALRQPIDVDDLICEFNVWLDMTQLWAYRPEFAERLGDGLGGGGSGSPADGPNDGLSGVSNADPSGAPHDSPADSLGGTSDDGPDGDPADGPGA